LREHLEGALPAAEEAAVIAHLDTCAACQQMLEGLAAGSPGLLGTARQVGQEPPAPESALRDVLDELKEEAGGSRTAAEPADRAELALDFLSPADKPGQMGRLGHYEVLEVIGRGGMGVVLKAFDEKLRRIVAIKVMAPQVATSATARKRFVREAQAAAAVRNEHVIAIYAVEEASPVPYLVMEYVCGVSLQERLDRSGPLALREILRIGIQTAAGLSAAHAHGLVHRDIKPANILLENGVERVKLTDFGLARAVDDVSLTQSGVVAGTPQYMAPEQASGGVVDHRADLFSLGSVLYALCTGRAPFRASATMAVLKRVCEDTPRPIQDINPDIPDWLVQIIGKLHAKAPGDRYQSAAELAEVLRGHLAQLQQPAVAPLPGPPSPLPLSSQGRGNKGGGRRRWAAAAVLLVLLGGLGLSEATGVTKLTAYVATVLRIKTPEGTLVVEVNDPEVKVTIEGDGGLVITGAGPQEVRLRPGSYQVQASKDGKPIRLDRELVTISRGDKQVVRVRLEGEAPPPAKAPAAAELGPFVVLGGEAIPERRYETLAEAALGASDGDTIEVHGNGPFVTPPINLGKTALRIRAGAGFRPIIRLSPEGLETDDPLIETSAPLVLEGLELQRVGQKPRKKYLRTPNIVISDGAPFWVANCRFIMTPLPNASLWCLYGVYSQTCVVRNCEFISQGLGFYWNMPWRGQCSIENCLHLGVNLVGGDTCTREVEKVSINLARNTVVRPTWQVAWLGVRTSQKVPPAGVGNQPLRVKASANVFDAFAVLGFAEQTEKQLRGVEAEALLLRLLEWCEERNLYAPGTSTVSWNHEPHGPKNLPEWNRFWRQGDTGSVEGRVRYQGGNLIARSAIAPEKITPEDFRLRPDSAGYRARKDGKDLGADVDLVGPGRAYERWKKTPGYQQWLKETVKVVPARKASPPAQAPAPPLPPEGKVPSPAQPAAQAERQAFVVLSGKGALMGKYDTLAEAVLGASDGDTIEVRGNGPFVTPPLNLGMNALRIRAGVGFRPIIKLSPEGLEADAPLIETSAPLVLEGLELQRVGQKHRKEFRRQPTMVTCDRAPFWFANCRFVGTPLLNASWWCIFGCQSETWVVRNCEFMTFDLALYWDMPGRGRGLMENCLHSASHGVGARYRSEVENASISFARNTVVRPRSPVVTFNVLITPNLREGGPALRPLRVEAAANIFDADSVLALDQQIEKLEPLKGAEAEAFLRRLLDWREERNLYAPGTTTVTWEVNYNYVEPHGPKNMAEWNRFWRQADTGSVEGRVRYQGGNLIARAAVAPEKLTPEDFRLRPDSAGYRAGKDRKDLGADVDLVGPGKAYERWKKTPEYEQWLKETGQGK
jgi:serine/threonine protein kinase